MIILRNRAKNHKCDAEAQVYWMDIERCEECKEGGKRSLLKKLIAHAHMCVENENVTNVRFNEDRSLSIKEDVLVD